MIYKKNTIKARNWWKKISPLFQTYTPTVILLCKSDINEAHLNHPVIKLRVVHAPGMPRTFSPPSRVSDLDMQHGTCANLIMKYTNLFPLKLIGLISIRNIIELWGKFIQKFPDEIQHNKKQLEGNFTGNYTQSHGLSVSLNFAINGK